MIGKQKCLAFVGTGEGLLPYIYKAKEMGIKTVLFARGKDTFARDQIDIFVEENNFDIKYMASKCKELHVDGIMAFTDFTTEVVAKVAHEAGLPGNEVQLGFAGNNKYLMRCRVKNLKCVKQPKFELYEDSHVYDFPVVVKALDSSGKKGVTLVTNKEELAEAINYARKYSSEGKILMEEYIEGGKEYSLECLCSDPNYYIIQITEQTHLGAPHFVELGHHQPALLSSSEKKQLNKVVPQILKAIGLTCGMAHLEVKIIDYEIYFIEVGARGGGEHIADTLISLTTDYDYYKGAIKCALGIPLRIDHINYTNCAGLYCYCKQNEYLKDIFYEVMTNNPSWCFYNTIENTELREINSNADGVKAGYFLYLSDEKINIDNYKEKTKPIVVEINNLPNAYKMLWDYYKDNKTKLSDEDLDSAVKNVLNKGKVLSIIKNYKITDCVVLSNDKIYTYPELLDVVDFEDSSYIGSNQSLLLNKAISILKEH